MGFFDFLKPKAVDPVCKMKVVKKADAVKTTYKEQEYYFCSDSCKAQFDQSPEKFLAPAVPVTPAAPPAPPAAPTQA